MTSFDGQNIATRRKNPVRTVPCILLALALMMAILLCPKTADAASFNKKAKPKFKVVACMYKGGKAVLKWKKVKGANKYVVYRAKKKNGKYKQFKATKKCQISKKSVGEFYYKVRAFKGKTGGKYSAPVHLFPGIGNIYNSMRMTTNFGFYSRTTSFFYLAFRNNSKRKLTIAKDAECYFYQYDPVTGKLVDLNETGTVSEAVTIAKGKTEALTVVAGLPLVDQGTVLVVKVPFQAGGKKFYFYMGREAINMWIPAITK